MAEGKYTKGSWSVYKDDPLIIVNEEGSSLGEMSAGDPYISHEEMVANAQMAAAAPDLLEALDALVNAKALKDVRGIVAGWNGEGKEDGPYERHPNGLGAILPKTNCGAVYALDEAMIAARAAISKATGSSHD